jgi:hypothetical protein
VASFRYRVGSRYVAVVWRLEMICGPQLSAEKNKNTKKEREDIKEWRAARLCVYTRVRGSNSAGPAGRSSSFFLF